MRPWGVELGIVSEAKKAAGKGKAAVIMDLAKNRPEAITKEIILDAAKKGDEMALGLLEKAGKDLGVRIAYMIDLLNPSMVIIGGGMEAAGDLLFEPIKSSIKKFAFEEPASIVKVVPSFLGENAIVMGAAALSAREVFIQA